MSRPALEVADIFRDHGAAWRRANAGHVSLEQMKVMSAIERCRTAALGGHVARCQDCPHTVIAYNSCRNRHCPKCQSAAAAEWLAARETDLHTDLVLAINVATAMFAWNILGMLIS
jgi:predicted Zn-ribbon and HTH transcriptional regulator